MGGSALARVPVTIAILWLLSALAAILPIEQAVLTEATGLARIGRALGLYEATTLLAAASPASPPRSSTAPARAISRV
ncbi:hypothetical protein DZF98_00345 [Clavibacter californiensis]|uniref:MFS transporter n=1 Tax=Clavibacter californiensis TaxID=1401995 RepID=A0ABX9N9K2_9MICO|nr:hypothetical protein DZF98_00345 [Clavibacter californiensis]